MANTVNFTIEKATVGGNRNTWGGLQNLAIDKIDELLALALPVGTIQMYTKSTAPTATTNGGTWLVCDGTDISRTTYSALFAVIGETYGPGDGSTDFALPDMRSRVPVGYSTSTVGSGDAQRTPKSIAASGGEESHTLSLAELQSHTHPLPLNSHTHTITEPNAGAGHTHTGANSGKTANASTGITSPDHTHEIERWHDGAGGSPTHQVQINYLSTGLVHSKYNSEPTSVSITDPQHAHDFTTTSATSGISVDNAVTGITATSAAGSSSSHENLPPYQVINYIILAKHPTF